MHVNLSLLMVLHIQHDLFVDVRELVGDHLVEVVHHFVTVLLHHVREAVVHVSQVIWINLRSNFTGTLKIVLDPAHVLVYGIPNVGTSVMIEWSSDLNSS